MHRVYFYRDHFYEYCSQVICSSEIQKSNLFSISRTTFSNPAIVELVIHPQTNDFRIARLLLHLCNNRCALPKLFV